MEDEMMLRAKVEVSSIESPMTSPLSRFNHFAANDYGYGGTRYVLTANWFHPLFLKAKIRSWQE